ncbi:TetR/AcrR family transcriptional regulator [Adhaeribacter swui]|uniref:TetR/AcrR family transcriptional regulator n=1 Tax=Adhaeribacter swui TaxID=2086471 RepID=A0A7G7GD47_9BACT|nr:TetR/AcrR family transcriptional regulator [Adhaeribacter swui]QNF35081.1 TetR/AcrR family transcriptional regulator [Adhaeribacter swui]
MSTRFIQKREATMEVILKVGLELFANHGFHPTTIRMIAEKAGISLGLLYNYYKSKEEVLQAIFRKTLQEIQTGFTTFNQPEQKTTLKAFIRQYFRSVKLNRDFWKLYYSLQLSSVTALLIKQDLDTFSNTIQSMLEACLAEEEIPFPSLEAKLMLAFLDGLTTQFFLQEKYPVDDLVNLLLMKYQH